jgi:conjugal transfer pilus assembly protein TraF
MAKKYGFSVKYISMDGKGLPEVQSFVNDNGISKTINLKLTPTTVLAIPPKDFVVVSQGVMSQDDLKHKILQAALMKKALPAEMEASVNPWDRGVLTAEDLKHGATDDPEALSAYIRKQLEAHY